MDTLVNLRTFLSIARTGNFSETARQIGVAPSVVTKRINQLEDQMATKLFERSTRKVALTEAGERYLPKVRNLIREFDGVLAGESQTTSAFEGHIRIKSPTTIAAMYLGRIFCEFQSANSGVTIDLVLMDRSVNPIEEGFDIAIGALSASYGGVIDIPLCPYPRMVCASPDYIARRGRPEHPRDLIDHDCLTFGPTGTSWTLNGASGTVSVNIHSKFNTNDNQMLLMAASAGNGIAVLSTVVSGAALRSGELVQVLDDYRPEEFWLKAMVPENRAEVPRVQELLKWLQAEFAPVPPWDRVQI